MSKRLISILGFLFLLLPISSAWADEYTDTIAIFQDAGESGDLMKTAYGYAVFPTVGKVGVGIGGAYGKGRVYRKGEYIGDTSVKQLSVGLQAGGQAYSQLILFQHPEALKEFTNGNFEFGAEASAVAITAGLEAKTGTTGGSLGASGGKRDATTAGRYRNGIAIFTVAKGGLMYEASVGGQKFTYTPKGQQ
jgi:lipid-binding SYLF domain-containing protein